MSHRFDVVIKNGTVIDGRNMPRRRTDLAIKDGRIARIGRVDVSDAEQVIDASGLVVAPGFVDTHTHYDAQVFWDPYCTLSGWHGVTSVVIGNCGFGFAPAHAADHEYLMRSLTRVEAIPYAAIKASLPWTWESFAQWLDQLDRQPKGVNLLASVPVNPLLVYVMGLEAAKTREPTDDELDALRDLLRDALAAGACGWSAQHAQPGTGADIQRDHDGTPFATDLMSARTAEALASVVAEFDDAFLQLAWFSSEGLAKSKEEVEAIAVAADSPVIWNALATDGRHPTKHHELIEWLDSCRERGVPLLPQVILTDNDFFFTFEDWNMFDDSPTWRDATLGTVEERLAKLGDPARRQGLRDVPPGKGLQRITILRSFSPRFEHINNMRLVDAARILGYDDITDCLLDIIVEDGLRTKLQMPEFNEDPELQAELTKVPYGLWGLSDGGAHTKFLTFGAFPTEALVRFTKERELVSLEEAHWHLSGLPAHAACLKDRGVLVEGAAADVIVYDHDALALLDEEVVHDLPGDEWRRVRRATGYRYILVNGEITFCDGVATGALPGQLIRRGAGS